MRTENPVYSTKVECVRCGESVELPPIPGRPGHVSIEPLTGWTAPPPRCPECSRDVAILGPDFGRPNESQGG